MNNLVIVESPTKARTLTRFLTDDYQIEATMGHIRDLPEDKLGIKINQKKNSVPDIPVAYDFVPEYLSIPDRKKRISQLKKIANNAKRIILATDPDREGEAIAYHVSKVLDLQDRGALERIVFHEITKSAILDALNHPRNIDMPLVDAQQARRMLDRIVGYKLSPLLWNKLGKRWLSAGRVQTVAVRLIAEREREIQAFKSEEYWIIDVEFIKNTPFLARLAYINDKKADIKEINSVNNIVLDLKNAEYKIFKLENKEVRRFPSPPFTTSTLQQAASNRYGWSAKKTMRAAQSLYEQGLITYHRTDSTNLSGEAIGMVRQYISIVFGKEYVPDIPKYYKTKSKVAQEAHEAIRPTNIKIISGFDMKRIKVSTDATALDESLGREGELLYSLIWKRFIACQMNEAVYDVTNVDVKGEVKAKVDINNNAVKDTNYYILKSTGERQKFKGWQVIYGDDTKQEVNNKELPQLTEGEQLVMQKVLPQQKFTEPPARFTEASLIKTLEEKGIGRPSTYAPIISTIQDRKYVEKIEKKFHPTDLGFLVVDFLIKYFPDIFDALFTAKMEDSLDNIANGNDNWQSVLSNFYHPFQFKLDQVFKTAERVKMDLGTTDEKCPLCGSVLTIKLSKFGKFLACPNFPKCKFTKNIVEKVGIPCPRCGGDIVLKRTRRGKQFYGCGNFPNCNFAAWKKEDIK